MTPSDVKIVADNINDFIELPNGINRLRKAVLTLAVSGQLVEQHENEGTAEDLYTQIQVERAEFDISRRKKVRVLNSITDDEVPFDLPSTWKWVRIREITHDYGQKTPDKDFYYVDVSSINSSKGEVAEPKLIKPSEASSRARKIVQDGSVIYSGIRPYLLNTALVNSSEYDKEVIVSTAFFVLKPFGNISSEFVHLIVRSPYFDQLANQACVGAAYPAINDDKFEKLPFPLPPLPEQERIVRRVKEVMSQLDELESQKNERDLVRSRLTRSAMYALGSTDSKVAFEQLNELITTPQDVNELESAILNLAVTGKLTDQDVKEGNAVDLMQDILKIKQELINLKKLKSPKQNNIPLTIRDFNLPENWTWVKGDEVFFITKLAGFEYTEHIKLSDIGDVPVIRAQNVRKYNIDRSSLKYISSEVSALLNRSALTKPCLLVTFIGAGIGEVALFDEEIRWHLAPNVAKMELFENCDSILNLKYFNYYLASGYGQREIFKHMKETAQPSLSMGTIRDIDYPLPPTEEQNRIVKKVEELMCLMNQLRKVIG